MVRRSAYCLISPPELGGHRPSPQSQKPNSIGISLGQINQYSGGRPSQPISEIYRDHPGDRSRGLGTVTTWLSSLIVPQLGIGPCSWLQNPPVPYHRGSILNGGVTLLSMRRIRFHRNVFEVVPTPRASLSVHRNLPRRRWGIRTHSRASTATSSSIPISYRPRPQVQGDSVLSQTSGVLLLSCPSEHQHVG